MKDSLCISQSKNKQVDDINKGNLYTDNSIWNIIDYEQIMGRIFLKLNYH